MQKQNRKNAEHTVHCEKEGDTFGEGVIIDIGVHI